MDTKTLKRAVVFSDISGFGKCALSVSIALMSAVGVEVLPVPTAVLSTNMKFKDYFIKDMTDGLAAFLEHWNSIAIKPDAVYTGFMSSVRQAGIVCNYLEQSEAKIKLVDPIMGDNGRRYSSFDAPLCDEIKKMCRFAGIITPNLTEAQILTNSPFSTNNDREYLQELCEKLYDDENKSIIITGVERKNSTVCCIYDKTGYSESEAELLDFKMSGTGDMFSSILCAELLLENNLDRAVGIAQKFILLTMKASLNYSDHENRGVCYEPYLNLLSNTGIKRSELL